MLASFSSYGPKGWDCRLEPSIMVQLFRHDDFFFLTWNKHARADKQGKIWTFAPIATAHFSRISRIRHASQTTTVNTVLNLRWDW